jgi:hypothetical protein
VTWPRWLSTLIASQACRHPITPGTTPSTPLSLQLRDASAATPTKNGC